MCNFLLNQFEDLNSPKMCKKEKNNVENLNENCFVNSETNLKSSKIMKNFKMSNASDVLENIEKTFNNNIIVSKDSNTIKNKLNSTNKKCFSDSKLQKNKINNNLNKCSKKIKLPRSLSELANTTQLMLNNDFADCFSNIGIFILFLNFCVC